MPNNNTSLTGARAGIAAETLQAFSLSTRIEGPVLRPLPRRRSDCLAALRRFARTHAFRHSQILFFGHDLPSVFCGRRRRAFSAGALR
jgi:hypothetical protein